MDLGQVFTRENVADYMANMLSITPGQKVLDPCFGSGAFLKALHKKGYRNVTGFEIDDFLVRQVRKEFLDYNLIHGDFLRSKSSGFYDAVIMNPPYIRHEKINNMDILGISKDRLESNPLYKELPRKANLYMYFILKGFDALKENGEMIVIFPGSWTKTSSGKDFQKTILEHASLKRIIHISGDVFEKSALVDVIILKLIKGNSEGDEPVPEYIQIKENHFEKHSLIDEKLNLGFSVPFSAVAKARRGLTTGYNKMFINPKISKGKPYIKSIISSPKAIDGYTTDGAIMDTLFAPDSNLDYEGRQFIANWKKIIQEEERPRTLFRELKDPKWYRLRIFDCHGILFSYFVRNDIKFILNRSDALIRDNFYVIHPYVDDVLLFGLLNNYYTYYQLECLGKKYGAGLLKIQRYDLDSLCFPDLKLMSEVDKERILTYASLLVQQKDRTAIDSITKIISAYAQVDFITIQKAYADKVSRRLEGM